MLEYCTFLFSSNLGENIREAELEHVRVRHETSHSAVKTMLY